jgi:hypothetical protein
LESPFDAPPTKRAITFANVEVDVADVSSTCSFLVGLLVPRPTLLFVASTYNVPESKLISPEKAPSKETVPSALRTILLLAEASFFRFVVTSVDMV